MSLSGPSVAISGGQLMRMGVSRADAAAHVHHGVARSKYPGGVSHAVGAGRSNRSDDGEPHLAAVQVAGEHQVDIVALGPPELIR